MGVSAGKLNCKSAKANAQMELYMKTFITYNVYSFTLGHLLSVFNDKQVFGSELIFHEVFNCYLPKKVNSNGISEIAVLITKWYFIF